MKKYINSLYESTESVIKESLAKDLAEFLDEDEAAIEQRISKLSFADYLALGNALELEDKEEIEKMLRRARVSEADNPYKPVTPPSQQLPSDNLAQQNTQDASSDDESTLGRKDVDDLTFGDEIEVADIDGQPAPAKVITPRGPGETVVVKGKGGGEHIVKKDAIIGTPKVSEEIRRMKELAGIKETASAGATGAGAIATSPTPMGSMHSRNPSIYPEKPAPKDRRKKGKKSDRRKKD